MHILRQRLLGEEWSSPGVEASGLDTLAGARYSTGGSVAELACSPGLGSSIRSLPLAARPAVQGCGRVDRRGR